jgi:hypothetical protein
VDGTPYPNLDFYDFFDLMDTNGDGELTFEEFNSSFFKVAHEAENQGYPVEEFTKWTSTSLQTWFENGDFDSSGRISPGDRQYVGLVPWTSDDNSVRYEVKWDDNDEWIPFLSGSGIPFDDHRDVVIDIIIAALGHGDEGAWFENEKRCVTVVGGEEAIFGIKDADNCTLPDGANPEGMEFLMGDNTTGICAGPRDVCYVGDQSGTECEWVIQTPVCGNETAPTPTQTGEPSPDGGNSFPTPAPTPAPPPCVSGFDPVYATYEKCDPMLLNGGTQCQIGAPGATLRFLLKDGEGCAAADSEIGVEQLNAEVNGTTLSCMPRPGFKTNYTDGCFCKGGLTLLALRYSGGDLNARFKITSFRKDINGDTIEKARPAIHQSGHPDVILYPNSSVSQNAYPYLKGAPDLEVQLQWIENWYELQIENWKMVNTSAVFQSRFTLPITCAEDIYVGMELGHGWSVTNGTCQMSRLQLCPTAAT